MAKGEALMTAAYRKIDEGMNELLHECVRRGMKLPFICVVVGNNGAVLVTRVHGDRASEELASLGNSVLLPANMMIVDANGDAGRVLIDAKGATFH